MNEGDTRNVRIGLVSVSDRASRGVYEDRGIPSLNEWLDSALATTWEAVVLLIPDERELIEAVLRGQALIVNLPGQPKAIRETLDGIFAAVPYCIELIGGPVIETRPEVVKAFRPASAGPKK